MKWIKINNDTDLPPCYEGMSLPVITCSHGEIYNISALDNESGESFWLDEFSGDIIEDVTHWAEITSPEDE